MSENDTDLEYSLKFKESSEFDSLYRHGKWSIDEVDKDGKVVNADLIPWQWGEDFSVRSIEYVASVDYRNSDDSTETQEVLRADLEQTDLHGTALEMFGTNRIIKNISLIIDRSSNNSSKKELDLSNQRIIDDLSESTKDELVEIADELPSIIYR